MQKIFGSYVSCLYICAMAEINLKSVDVSRLYSMTDYSEKFNVNYHAVYQRLNSTLLGKARNPFVLVPIGGTDFIYVTEEEEKELLKKKGGKK